MGNNGDKPVGDLSSEPVERTVVINREMDKVVRSAQATLITMGYEVTYSMALNVTVLTCYLGFMQDAELSAKPLRLSGNSPKTGK